MSPTTEAIMSNATIEELLEAFAALSDADLLALRKAASLRLDGTQFTEPADLMHEALTRCLDGRRRWPKAVPFPVFLYNAMKSIASADRRLHSSKLVIQASELETDLWRDPLGSLGDMSPSAEADCIRLQEGRLSRELLARLRKEFAGDVAVDAVMSSWPDELGSREIMKRHGLTFREYDAARKRIERSGSVKTMKARRLN